MDKVEDVTADDERLMTLLGELGQAVSRARAAGADVADIVVSIGQVLGETAAAGHADMGAVMRAVMKTAPRAYQLAMKGALEGREALDRLTSTYRRRGPSRFRR